MHKRILCLLIAFCILFASSTARIAYITFNDSYIVSDSYNSYSLIIDKPQFQLYFRDGTKLNNDIESYVGVIKPNEKCIGELSKFFSRDEINVIMDRLSKGYPITVDLDKKIDAQYISVFKTHKSSNTCPQLINESSSGLLKYTEKPTNCTKMYFLIDARGKLLLGDEGTVREYNDDNNKGLTLTIDKKLQELTEFACENMQNGCCIVMSVETGEILSCVNKPDSCYVNKCFSNYPVGSIFKLIVSASALENDVTPIYNCNGSITVGDSSFNCQNNNKHGYESLKIALANSCNCYFINLALELGSEKIINTAEKLGFNGNINIYSDWNVNSSNLPSNEALKSKGQLALFGFGQGQLTATPLQICSALCTIASNGIYNKPSLILNNSIGKQVLKKETSRLLLNYMRYVVTNGTAYYAEDTKHKSAGKTSTAQTGQYQNGREILNTWFGGVYPYDNPKYAIVVMNEDGISGSVDCCPIFRTIVENLDKI